jgi:hypothetical protein
MHSMLQPAIKSFSTSFLIYTALSYASLTYPDSPQYFVFNQNTFLMSKLLDFFFSCLETFWVKQLAKCTEVCLCAWQGYVNTEETQSCNTGQYNCCQLL